MPPLEFACTALAAIGSLVAVSLNASPFGRYFAENQGATRHFLIDFLFPEGILQLAQLVLVAYEIVVINPHGTQYAGVDTDVPATPLSDLERDGAGIHR